MKSTRIILMALCLTALTWGGTSCKKDKDIHNQGEKMTISAGIDQTSVGNTKTFLCPTASGVLVKWSANEKFTLFGNGSTQGEEFVMVSGAGQQSAQFDGEVPAGGAPYFAAYPSNGTFNGSSTFTFAMPATIQYVAETNAGTSDNFISLQQHNAPMVGKSADGGNLQFHNAMSTIFLDLKGGAKITKIVLTDLGGHQLNGTLTVTVDGEGKVASSTLAGGNSNLTLDLGDGVTLDKDKYSMFCFPVPEGAFAGAEGSKNVKIDIYDVSGTIIKTIEKSLAAGVASNGAYQVVENKVRPFLLPEGFTVRSKQGFSDYRYRKVYFTKGNLWYNKDTGFHFEENQWSTANMDGQWNNTHLGHFYSSNSISTAVGRNAPSSPGRIFTNDNSDMLKPREDLTVDGVTGVYLSLTMDDYNYLITGDRRKSTVGITGKSLWGMGTVNEVTGLILLPDNWDASQTFGGMAFNYGGKKYTDNVFGGEDWEDMEYYGAVFLPASGLKGPAGDYTSESFTAIRGLYWSSRCITDADALYLANDVKPATVACKAKAWGSIRLAYYGPFEDE